MEECFASGGTGREVLLRVPDMEERFASQAVPLKAIADKNRLMIVDMLSSGELCACRILDRFHFTQPTLSHHMKILCDSGLVDARKVGKWIFYSLNRETAYELMTFLCEITTCRETSVYREEAPPGCGVRC